jgi:cyclase
MLKRRLIPRFLARKSSNPGASDFEVCISRHYSDLKIVGNLGSQLSIFESNKADELLVINAHKEKRSLDPEFINALRNSIEKLSTPIMVGGSINSIEDVSELVAVGVDKVLCGITTLNHELHTQIANVFGSQALSVSIDYALDPKGFLIGFTQKRHFSESSFKSLIRNIQDSGAGEIILNRFDLDGTRSGLDIETLQTALTVATVPIIVASGAGKPEHFIDAFDSGADGVATGTYFAKMDQSPLQLRSRLFNAGVNIRA